MAKLNPVTVAKAARMLFGTGHSEAIVFFFLKAQGASTDSWIHITSAAKPPDALIKIAGQPAGFDKLVIDNIDKFAVRKSRSKDDVPGLPTKPGARGESAGYTMFFPITEEAQYILRKHDCNRNAVWSNLTGGRTALNASRASRDDIYDIQKPERPGTDGRYLRFKPKYTYNAYWYYGPKAGVPMRIPLQALAIWMHRTDDIPFATTIEELVRRTVDLLYITPEEQALLFDESPPNEFPLAESDYTEDWHLESYFGALCLPQASIPIRKPVFDTQWAGLTEKLWNYRSLTYGFRRDKMTPNPFDTADALVMEGERNLLFYGPPRTSKSHFASQLAARYLGTEVDKLAADSRFKRVQFHQGWSYGDFIRKVMPTPSKGGLAFIRVNGVFLSHCTDNPEGKSVFIVDEINRANIADVFGEAFQVVERGYRGSSIDLPGSIADDEVKSLVIPRDLLLITTANDLDRTTFPLDFAFLSRFATVTFPVEPAETLKALKKCPEWTTDLAEKFVELLREAAEITEYPVGHANFYRFGPPKSVLRWYLTSLRPALQLYLTQYGVEKLKNVDALFENWQGA